MTQPPRVAPETSIEKIDKIAREFKAQVERTAKTTRFCHAIGREDSSHTPDAMTASVHALQSVRVIGGECERHHP